ncbi:peptidylprolyl isomerase [Chlorobium sp. KB01]|uniref:peptidylprolyl isomerase n=1 Tax=Chlorobium sp. KB01 TaxID=1917528 RepID=UPI000977B9C9|nr:peptidylprolyl isomerase [Chlorobium sp. KB01]
MNRPLRTLSLMFGLLATLLPLSVYGAPALDRANTIYLDLPAGRVVIRLLPDLAPRHVARIKELTRKGFYDGLSFHRVIPGFMAQTGDPQGDGSGGSGQQLKAEFSRQQHIRGTVSMARASDPNSGDSQFFICFAPAPFLDGQYTIWGQVVSGMEFVDKVRAGSQFNNGMVSNPTRIMRMRVAQDVKP